jgi:hypothetical protein
MRAIQQLAGEGSICKPGRDAFVQQGVDREYCLPPISNLFESVFRRVDASRRRGLIGLSRIGFIWYQRWLEPHMVRRYQPALVVSTRCMIIDPAIYCDIYWPTLGRFSLKRKIAAFHRLSGVPFRDLYVFLRTPPGIALDRIHRRIGQTPGLAQQPRDYWLHLHESEPILARLGGCFEEALRVARSIAAFDLVEIETARYDESEVAQKIVDEIRNRLTVEHRTLAATCA